MKKLFILFLFVIMFSGCRASYDDAFKMIDKMENMVNDEKVFDEYRIVGMYTINERKTNYSLLKDNDNYYVSIDEEYHYVIKNNDNYHIYSSVDGVKTHTRSNDDVLIILRSLMSRVDINVDMREAYINISSYIKENLNKCNEMEESIDCNLEKELFNIIHYEFIIYGIDNKRVNNYTIDNGKLKYISSEYISNDLNMRVELKYDYSNQKIKDFDKSEYKIKSS